jgi:hypothetical protein
MLMSPPRRRQEQNCSVYGFCGVSGHKMWYAVPILVSESMTE